MSSADSEVIVERRHGVMTVKINAPTTRNSLSLEALGSLIAAFESIDINGDRCLVVTGASRGAFCSGFRLDANAGEAVGSGAAFAVAENALQSLSRVEIPTVAVIDGPAYGLGCELALRCDIRLASDQASFAIPAVKRGLPPPSVDFLVRRYGQGAVAWLYLAGARVDAECALRIGFVQRVIASDELTSAVAEVLEYFRRGAPLVLRYVKAAVSQAEGAEESDVELITDALERVQSSRDFHEAMSAIDDRRQPNFTGH
jgi:enoyl-CoA hydratase